MLLKITLHVSLLIAIILLANALLINIVMTMGNVIGAMKYANIVMAHHNFNVYNVITIATYIYHNVIIINALIPHTSTTQQ